MGSTLKRMSWRLPPWPDRVLALSLLGITQAELWTVDVEGPRPVLAATLAVACVAVAFRRTAPLTATVVALVASMIVSQLGALGVGLSAQIGLGRPPCRRGACPLPMSLCRPLRICYGLL